MAQAREDAANDRHDQAVKMLGVRELGEKAREAVRERRAELIAMAAKEQKAADAQRTEERKAKAGKAPEKPKWAMTAEQVQDFDEEETCDLLDFVDALNFDEYIQDVEFREALAAVQGRARKLEKEQDAFKNALVAAFNEAGDEEGDVVADLPADLPAKSAR